MTVCSQWASVIADDPHRPCHVKSSKSVCSYQTGGSQQTQQQKLPSIPPSWLEDACRAPCSQILPHLALGLGEGRGLTYGLLCFVGYSFQLLRLHSSPSVSVEENAFPPKQLLSAFYAKTSSRAAWNPTVAVCPHNLRCCLCCSSHMFYFYKWLTQLLKNDNYLFYNVCFGGQYAVGIIWSAIACQQKGQSQFGDAKRTNNIPGTGCSCFSSGVIWGWTERVPNILWEQGERVGRLWGGRCTFLLSFQPVGAAASSGSSRFVCRAAGVVHCWKPAWSLAHLWTQWHWSALAEAAANTTAWCNGACVEMACFETQPHCFQFELSLHHTPTWVCR